MEEGAIALDENHLRVLRKDLEKLAIQSEFRKKFIGGISEEDVNKCINHLFQQFEIIEGELKTQIKELESSVEQLLKEFDTYKRSAEGEKNRLKQSGDNALADATRYMNESRHKDGIISDLNSQYEAELNRLNNEKEALESSCKRLKSQNETLELQIVQMQIEAEELCHEREGLQAQITRLEEDVLASQCKLDEQVCVCTQLRQDIDYEKQCNDCLNKDIEQLGRQAGEWQESLLQIQQQLQEELNKHQALEREAAEDREKLAECNWVINALTGRCERLEEQIIVNEKLLDEASHNKGNPTLNHIDAIQQQLEMLKEQFKINDLLQQQLEEERQRAEKAEGEVSRFREWARQFLQQFNQEQQNLQEHFLAMEEQNRMLREKLSHIEITTVLEIEDICDSVEENYEVIEAETLEEAM